MLSSHNENQVNYTGKIVQQFSVLCKQQPSRSGGAVGQSVRPASGRQVFDSLPRQTLDVKTGSDSSTAMRSAIGVSITVLEDDFYKGMPRVTVGMAR